MYNPVFAVSPFPREGKLVIAFSVEIDSKLAQKLKQVLSVDVQNYK